MAAAKKTTLHLCAKDFCGEGEAKATLAQEVKKLKLLRLVDQGGTAIKRDAKRRKPSPQAPVKRVDWKCHLKIDLDENAVAKKIWLGSGLVLATNLDTYKAQSSVEPGFQFLGSQPFLADALFWNKPAPIEGLLTLMCLSLRVYAMAQLRLRR